MSDESGGATLPKRNALTWAEVDGMTAGIGRYEKTSFWVIGHRGGTRLAVPKTVTGVSRAYFYGPYESIPAVPGVITHMPEARKDARRGGIVAEVDFGLGLDVARGAFAALVDAVRAAPPPAPRGEKRPRKPKEPKGSREPKAAAVEPESDFEDGQPDGGE